MKRILRIPRLFSALCCFLAAVCAWISAAPTAAADDETVPTYRVGYIAVPGFFTKDKAGTFRGSGYEYLEQLATYADCRFEYVDLTGVRTSTSLLDGTVDLLVGSTSSLLDPRFLRSEHSVGRTPLQISLAEGVGSGTPEPLRIGYYVNAYPPAFLRRELDRFYPEGGYTLLPYDDFHTIDDDLLAGRLDGVANDGLHPQRGAKPAGNLRMVTHYILYRPDEAALKARLDDAANDMLTVTPYLQYMLALRQERRGAPLFLTSEEKAWLAAHPHIRAFASPSQAPYAYFEFGVHKGVVQDIIDRIEQDLGIQFDIVETANNEELFTRLDRGEADVMCDFFYDYHWAHQHNMVITNPYLTVNYVLVHRRGRYVPDDPIIAAPRSRNFTHQYIERTYPERNIRYYDTDEDCLRAVESGYADIAAIKSISAQALIYKNGLFLLEAENAVVYTQGTSIAVSSRVDPIFVRILNKEIAHLDPTLIQSDINRETRAMTEHAPVTALIYRSPVETFALFLVFFLLVLAGVLFFFHVRRSHVAEISRLAYLDPVTKLRNERWFEKELPLAIARHAKERAAGRLYLAAICVRQLDYYRATYSRPLLAKTFVGEIHRASDALPWFDIFAVAGDRARLFMLWALPQGLTPQQAAEKLAHSASVVPFGDVMTRIRYHVSALRIPKAGTLVIPDLMNTVSTTLATARAQNQPFVLFDDSMRDQLAWASKIEAIAPRALAEQEFEVFYQPKYDLQTGALVGAEALVRWQSKELGFLPPGRFIDVFERNGFAVRLDYYMLGHVARFLERRIRRGLPVVPVSVNQSALHISEGGYLQKMKETSEAYGLPDGLIDLEITETAFVDFKTKEARENSRHIIDELKSYGYATSMDDFCTGYSSIAMLQNLPMGTMKIDRSILLAAEHDDRSARILENVIKLGSDLGMKILCEGIETEAQERLLKELGCTYGQGYLYAKPMNEKDFESFMADHLQ